MESVDQDSPKARFRFGFSGKRKRAKPLEQTASLSVSSDDILDSLTRQASSQVGVGEQQTQSLELIGETDEQGLFSEPTLATVGHTRLETGRNLGRYAIVLMCLGGLAIVWLYSSGRQIFEAIQWDAIVQKTGVQSVFANPAQIAIMSIFAMIIALWIAYRRRVSRLQIPI